MSELEQTSWLNNDKQKYLNKIANMFKINGPEYKGAPMPFSIRGFFNEINIPYNMRFKAYDVYVTTDLDIMLEYTTQEAFNDEDAGLFIIEANNTFEALAERVGYDKPFNVILDVKSRDMEGDQIKQTITINDFEDDILEESDNQLKDLAKHNKKAKKGPLMTINTNCGDNEKNVAFFNHCTGADASSDCAGNACESFEGIDYTNVAVLNNYFSNHSVKQFIETLVDWAEGLGQTKALAEILNSLAERCEQMGYLDESFDEATLLKNISVEIYNDNIAYISEEGSSGSRYNIDLSSPSSITDAFDTYIHDTFEADL